jgi:hypothetical protein
MGASSNPIRNREQKGVSAVYTEWANAAARGDWGRHMSFYADRVEYFRDGAISRERIEKRKRAIFGGLTSYKLRFSETPKVRMLGDQAEITFDREWRLCRGARCNKGRARGTIMLSFQEKQWRIVGEKQIKK